MSDPKIPAKISSAKAKAQALAAAAKAAESVEEFDSDEDVITFEEQLALEKEEKARLANVKTKVDDDGTTMEWDEQQRAWFPKIDADFIASYQMNYGVDTSTDEKKSEANGEEISEAWSGWWAFYDRLKSGVDEQGKPFSDEEKSEMETQWQQFLDSDAYRHWYQLYSSNSAPNESVTGTGNSEISEKTDGEPSKKRKKKVEQKWFSIDQSHNKHVYITGMPTDITEEEFVELVSKYGVIEMDVQTRKPKLKLYREENGDPRGDGRCCYAHLDSVSLAFKLLDGYQLRGHVISAQPAQFHLKGEFDPSKRRKLTNKEKKEAKKLKEKKAAWGLDVAKHVRFRREKTVIVKGVFQTEEFDKDPLLLNQVRDKVRQEFRKFGTVRRVTVYDRNPEGVVRVDMSEAEEADVAVVQVNGRLLRLATPVKAETWDGKSKYIVEETEEQFAARREKYERDVLGVEENTEEREEELREQKLVAQELEYEQAPATPP